MNRMIALLAVAWLTGCAAGGGPPTASRSPTTAHGKPIHCMNHPGGWGHCVHTCNHEQAMAQGAAARCQDTCTPNAQPGQPPVCGKPPGCEFAQMDAHSAYASCMHRCASIPSECQ